MNQIKNQHSAILALDEKCRKLKDLIKSEKESSIVASKLEVEDQMKETIANL